MRRAVTFSVALLMVLSATPAGAEVTQQELRDARATMNAKAAALGDQVAELDAVLAQQAAFESRIARLQDQILDRNRQIALLALAAREQARAMYVGTGATPGGVAATPETIVGLGTKSAYLDVVVNTHTDAVNRLALLQVDERELQVELGVLLVEHGALVERVATITAEMQVQLEEANTVYQTLYAQWAREEAARRRAAAVAAAGRYDGPIDANGRMCPVAGATYFRDSWGEPRPGGREHHGTDMMAAEGTPLVAIENGSIWSLSSDPLGGIGLFIRGDSGFVYYYAHLSRYTPGLTAGMRVAVGQYVGYVGHTGDASSPHLHIGWYPTGYAGGSRNPYPLMVAICRG